MARRSESLVGRRVELVHMGDDPCPIEPGTTGTVQIVDGVGTLMVKWDDGRLLGLLPDIDKWKWV